MIKILHQIGELISNSTWKTTTESLKTSKLYLKGDYKVGFVGDMFEQRIDVLKLLDNDTILVINDWAMKFIPQKYRWYIAGRLLW